MFAGCLCEATGYSNEWLQSEQPPDPNYVCRVLERAKHCVLLKALPAGRPSHWLEAGRAVRRAGSGYAHKVVVVAANLGSRLGRHHEQLSTRYYVQTAHCCSPPQPPPPPLAACGLLQPHLVLAGLRDGPCTCVGRTGKVEGGQGKGKKRSESKRENWAVKEGRWLWGQQTLALRGFGYRKNTHGQAPAEACWHRSWLWRQAW